MVIINQYILQSCPVIFLKLLNTDLPKSYYCVFAKKKFLLFCLFGGANNNISLPCLLCQSVSGFTNSFCTRKGHFSTSVFDTQFPSRHFLSVELWWERVSPHSCINSRFIWKKGDVVVGGEGGFNFIFLFQWLFTMP